MLGVDTAVVLDGTIYGKPADAGHAEEMLERSPGGRTTSSPASVSSRLPGTR